MSAIDEALVLAAQEGYGDIVQLLLSRHADPVKDDRVMGVFPLLQAAQNGHESVVELLLTAGANPNSINSINGSFPLLLAAKHGHAEVVEKLLRAGAKTSGFGGGQQSDPTIIAHINGHTAISELIRKSSGEPKEEASFRTDEQLLTESIKPFLQAAQEGHDTFNLMLPNAGAVVNAKNVRNDTFPLLIAAQNGDNDVVRMLLEAGAQANAVNAENGTFPLLMAAQNGHYGIVRMLLQAGAEANAVNAENGTFPLLMAARNGHDTVVRMLLEVGSDPNREEPQGVTPLFLALANGYDTIAEMLRSAGASLPEHVLSEMREIIQPEIDAILQGTSTKDWPMPPLIAGTWTPPRDTAANTAVMLFLALRARYKLYAAVLLDFRATALPFYAGHTMVEFLVAPEPDTVARVISALVGQGSGVVLNGESPQIHAVNAQEADTLKNLSPEDAAAYLRFFCSAVCGEDGTFTIIDALDPSLLRASLPPEEMAEIERLITPLAHNADEADHHGFRATVKYADALFRSQFKVMRSGMVEMVEDEPLAADVPWRRQGYVGPFRHWE